MLARSGRLPATSGYAFEVKWDGFRALVSYKGGRRVVSRRGWDLTLLLPELEVPEGVALDGELVALGEDGLPSFPRVAIGCSMGSAASTSCLWRSMSSTTRASQRCGFRTDDEMLWRRVCERGLEGVIAKRPSGSYQPGRRGWVKVKNRIEISRTLYAAASEWRSLGRGDVLRLRGRFRPSCPQPPLGAIVPHVARPSLEPLDRRQAGSASGVATGRPLRRSTSASTSPSRLLAAVIALSLGAQPVRFFRLCPRSKQRKWLRPGEPR